MGLFGTSDPVKKEEKHLQKEAKREDHEHKTLEKELHAAEKDLQSSIKKEKDAIAHHESAQKAESKLAHKLSEAQASHEKSITDRTQAEGVVQSRQQAHQTAQQKVEQIKAKLDEFSITHKEHEAARQSRIEELHRIPEDSAKAAAGAGVIGAGAGAAGAGVAAHHNQSQNASGPNSAAPSLGSGHGHQGQQSLAHGGPVHGAQDNFSSPASASGPGAAGVAGVAATQQQHPQGAIQQVPQSGPPLSHEQGQGQGLGQGQGVGQGHGHLLGGGAPGAGAGAPTGLASGAGPEDYGGQPPHQATPQGFVPEGGMPQGQLQHGGGIGGLGENSAPALGGQGSVGGAEPGLPQGATYQTQAPALAQPQAGAQRL